MRESRSEKRPSPCALTDTLARKIAEFVNPRHGFWRLQVTCSRENPEDHPWCVDSSWNANFTVRVAENVDEPSTWDFGNFRHWEENANLMNKRWLCSWKVGDTRVFERLRVTLTSKENLLLEEDKRASIREVSMKRTKNHLSLSNVVDGPSFPHDGNRSLDQPMRGQERPISAFVELGLHRASFSEPRLARPPCAMFLLVVQFSAKLPHLNNLDGSQTCTREQPAPAQIRVRAR